MARSTKKKSKNTKAVTRKFWYLLFAIVTVGFVVSWVVIDNRNTQLHQKEQRQLAASLNEKGRALNQVASDLENSDIAGSVERSEFCYEASRKFAEGPTYCMQRLEVTADSVDDDKILSDIAIVADAINSRAMFNFVTGEGLDKFDENRLSASYYQSSREVYSNCSAFFSAKSSQWHAEHARNTYDVTVDCLATDFSEAIYEFKD